MNQTSTLDVLGYLAWVAFMGNFAFWLAGYFLYEVVKQVWFGPSRQLRSLDHPILGRPEDRQTLLLPPPKIAA